MKWELKKFEELTVSELYEILKLRCEIFVLEQECAYQDCDNKDIEAKHLYCVENGKIIAYLRILNRGVSFNEMSIGRVVVDRNNRGRGLAKIALAKAIKFVEEELNETEIRISAQKYIVKLYGELGFREMSDEYLEDGIPHVEMLYKK